MVECMVFGAPQWLLLIPALLLCGWIYRRLGLLRPLRLLCWLALVLVLAQPSFERASAGLELVLLVDVSDSIREVSLENLPEWVKLLEESQRGRHDRLRVIHYGAEAIEQEPGNEIPVENTALSSLSLALEQALSLRDPEMAMRVLVMSDGYHTESVEEVARRAAALGVPIDFRLLGKSLAGDTKISRFELPSRVQSGVPFGIEVLLEGPEGKPIPIKIFRGDEEVYSGTVVLKAGATRLAFNDRVATAGAFRYRCVITPEADSVAGNNLRERWLEVEGGPRVLVVSPYPDDPVAAALQGAENLGYEVELSNTPQTLRVEDLVGVRGVVLNNVGAFDLSADFLRGLPFFVKEQGGGLLMLGGERSFGAGGYFDSSIDPLLPVSMELKEDHVKMKVAIAVVLDRSGSMGMQVGGGKSKMDLANEGTARTIELLGAADEVAVIPVDTEAHVVVPMKPLGSLENQSKVAELARSIKSGGGGIYIFNGLNAGWKELRKSTAGTRHIILFSDASDSVEPGDYRRLLGDMRADGATVTVFGLGRETDKDAMLLKEIAELGEGRCVFTTNAGMLPQLFAQETTSLARSAFIKENTPTVEVGGWSEISEERLPWMASVEGYNLSYLRKGCGASLVTGDEYKAPLVAHVQRGAGRVAAVSFPLAGDSAVQVKSWQGYGEFLQSLTNWVAGDGFPVGVGLRQRLIGTTFQLDFLYSQEYEQEFAAAAPEVVLVADGDDYELEGDVVTQRLVWSRMRPGHFVASANLSVGRTYRGALQFGEKVVPFGPVMVGGDVEWDFKPERVEELRGASRLTRGKELVDFVDAWERPEFRAAFELAPSLFVVALITILLDALLTRMGWTLPEWSFASDWRPSRATKGSRRRQEFRAPVGQKATEPKEIHEATAVSNDELNEGDKQMQSRKDRFRRAKRKP